MLSLVRLPIAFLFGFPALINFSSFITENKSSRISNKDIYSDSTTYSTKAFEKNEATDVYSKLNLAEKGLSKTVFEFCLKGYQKLLQKKLIRNKNIITIIDFSKTSDKKRLYVIDLKRNKVLHHSLVAHGRNSGLEYATDFSNETDSHKSSLGFYITMNTYSGEHGYALKLKGCEKGFNSNAFSRAIVMHGSEYVNEEFVKSNGFLGRSWGCPALPEKVNKKIIDAIKNGSCLFVYHSSQKYLNNSTLLRG